MASEHIDHAAGANAYKLIDDVDSILDEAGRSHFGEREGALALIEATRAQALATLALVEQQRIANLIALGMYTNADGSRLAQHAVAHPVGEYDVAINDEIREGLGL